METEIKTVEAPTVAIHPVVRGMVAFLSTVLPVMSLMGLFMCLVVLAGFVSAMVATAFKFGFNLWPL